jgi:hypothetical protein
MGGCHSAFADLLLGHYEYIQFLLNTVKECGVFPFANSGNGLWTAGISKDVKHTCWLDFYFFCSCCKQNALCTHTHSTDVASLVTVGAPLRGTSTVPSYLALIAFTHDQTDLCMVYDWA